MRIKIENLLFRTIVLVTLLFVAAIFGLNENSGTAPEQYNGNANPTSPEVSPPKSFGGKLLDDPTAFFTAALAILTFVLAAVGAVQIFFLNRTDATARISADAARKAANVARDTLIVSNRAWIKLTVYNDALVQASDGCLNIGMRVAIANVGSAPAFQIRIWIFPFIDSLKERNFLAASHRLTETVRRQFPDAGGGITLFPGETNIDGINFTRWSFPATAAEINDGIAYGVSFNQIGFPLRAIVCVDYCFPSDLRSHQTRQIVSVNGRIDGWLRFNEIEALGRRAMPVTIVEGPDFSHID